jgi:spore coat polysaccharide biosynthesis protein SpsF
MEVGLLNKKVGFIIQARMRSTRLPGKILLPIPLGSGKPLLLWIIDELKRSKFNKEIIIATSINPENDVLVSFCDLNNIDCFRGDEENVLSRFTAISKQKKYDCIVRLTADNPIVDIAILDDTIANHFMDNNDYTKTEGLPVGMNFEIISSNALVDIENYEITKFDKEHVTLFVRNSDNYKKGVYIPKVNDEFNKLRLTVDYASDYSMLSTILTQCNPQNNLKGISLIEYTYNIYPWLFDANSSNIQKKQYKNFDEEIKDACVYLDQLEFKNVSEILRDNSIVDDQTKRKKL